MGLRTREGGRDIQVTRRHVDAGALMSSDIAKELLTSRIVRNLPRRL